MALMSYNHNAAVQHTVRYFLTLSGTGMHCTDDRFTMVLFHTLEFLDAFKKYLYADLLSQHFHF